jgi:hypothetical protein
VEERRVAREQVLAFRARAHGLDERRPRKDLLKVVGACGIQDTPPGNADVALAARLDIDAPVVADAVAKKRLALTWSVRGAPHVMPPGDLPVFTLGARPADGTLQKLWRQPEDAIAAVEKAMVAALRTSPRPKGEVSEAVTKAVRSDLAHFCRSCDVRHPDDNVFRAGPLLGRIVLTSTAPVLLARAKTWLGTDASGDLESLRTELLLRYLHCYAPTTSGDFAVWAGITAADAKARWEAISDAVVPVKVDKRAYVLEDDLDALERATPTRGVRLVPPKDVYMQARDRGVLLPDKAQRTAVFTVLGGPGLVLVDGEPAASWRGSTKGKRYELTVEPLRALKPKERAAVDDEAQRVAHVRGHEAATVRFA